MLANAMDGSHGSLLHARVLLIWGLWESLPFDSPLCIRYSRLFLFMNVTITVTIMDNRGLGSESPVRELLNPQA